MSDRLNDMLKLLLLKGLMENLTDDDDDELKQQVEGLRVVRGPDWKWGNQDHGEGQLGTVRLIKDKEGIVQVVWDHGGVNDYRVGYEDDHDLRIFDNAGVGVQHERVSCDECKEMGIWGIRWKCQQCADFDLCTKCYMKDKHMPHSFYRIIKPGAPRIALPGRKEVRGLKKAKAVGIFAGAKVVRGKDWKWENQDGGSGTKGVVLKIDDWSSVTERNSAVVLWPNGNTNGYRVGYGGFADLQYTSALFGSNGSVAWGDYYPSHLPVLDLPKDYKTAGDESGDEEAGRQEPAVPAAAAPTVEASPRRIEAEVEEGKSHIGARVIRGKDWEWGSQDNGPFNMGTVEGVSKTSPGVVNVIWDHGVRADYRSGKGDKTDLKVVDNAPAGSFHSGIQCSGCGENPLRGIRWKCSVCDMVDLCTICYGNNKHDISHAFWRITTVKTERAEVPARTKGARMHLQGIFQGATVVRGVDWKWQSQDGGEGRPGTVVERHADKKENKLGHGWWTVKWQSSGGDNYYRLGLGGFVDLKAVKSATGYYVYADHLPDLVTIEITGSSLVPKNFSIVEKIGTGSFGEVFRCYDGNNGTDFAMKRVSLAGSGTHADIEKALDTFRQEIRLYSKLPPCTRVCKYLGSQVTETQIDIYLEYVPGGSLLNQLPLTESLAKKFTKQTLEGLDFLHRNRIIHRDVKCGNILRDIAGCVKLTDFGVGTEVAKMSLSKATKTTAGSLYWMAPEVLEEEGHNTKIDVWSLACTTVEMLTKNPPNFDAINIAQVVRRIAKQQLSYTLPAGISAECKDFLKTLLKFDPADRPSAAQALDHSYMRSTVA